jgi:putative transposase
MGGFVFHVFNRAARRFVLFTDTEDYRTFEEALRDALRRVPIRLLCYCVMPNHFHLVLWPESDEQLQQFMHRLTAVQAQRWRMSRQSVGGGAVYQGRYRAVAVEPGFHLIRVCRYVERNALRARLVDRAEQWPWGSLWKREHRATDIELAPWPTARPEPWCDIVNAPSPAEDLELLRQAIRRGEPIGGPRWREEATLALGIRRKNAWSVRPEADATPQIVAAEAD